MIELRSATPDVTVAVAPPSSLRAADFPGLDLGVPDHRIVAEVLRFRETNSAFDLAILTTDTGMRLTAKDRNVLAIKVPDGERWRLSEEPDDKDIRIRELEEKVRLLSNNFASVRVAFYSADGKELDGFPTDLKQYDDLNAKELDALVQLAEETHRFDFSSNLGQPTTVQGRWLDPVYVQKFYVQKYQQTDFPNWLSEIRRIFSELPGKLNRNEIEDRFLRKSAGRAFNDHDQVLRFASARKTQGFCWYG